jgi:hypothetical protein
VGRRKGELYGMELGREGGRPPACRHRFWRPTFYQTGLRALSKNPHINTFFREEYEDFILDHAYVLFKNIYISSSPKSSSSHSLSSCFSSSGCHPQPFLIRSYCHPLLQLSSSILLYATLWTLVQLFIISERSSLSFWLLVSFRFATLYAASCQFVMNQSGEG